MPPRSRGAAAVWLLPLAAADVTTDSAEPAWSSAHSLFRCRHGARPLRWDPAAATAAADAVSRCERDAGSAPSDRSMGENVLWATGDDALANESAVVGAWYGESYDPGYDFTRPASVQRGTFAFTQLVWVATEAYGCAWCKRGGNRTHQPTLLAVCRYRPSGNVLGHFGTNVRPPVSDAEAARVCALGAVPLPEPPAPVEPAAATEAPEWKLWYIFGGAAGALCCIGASVALAHRLWWRRNKDLRRRSSVASFVTMRHRGSSFPARPSGTSLRQGSTLAVMPSTVAARYESPRSGGEPQAPAAAAPPLQAPPQQHAAGSAGADTEAAAEPAPVVGPQRAADART